MAIVLESILWTSIGALLYRQQLASGNLPKFIAKLLYWVGVPLQIFFLARKSDYSKVPWIPSLAAIILILLALLLSWLVIKSLTQVQFAQPKKLQFCQSLIGAITPQYKFEKGSFILSSILGNTGFIGLTIVPVLVDSSYWSWVLLYGVAHNILGSYGLGAVIAEAASSSKRKSNWWDRFQSLLFLPSLWAFAYGYMSRNLALPDFLEALISKGILFLVPGAFLLIGMQLSKLQSLQNISSGIIPSVIKIIILPGMAGLILTLAGFEGEGRLALVLMSGMPTAFASIILAEEHDLDRAISANSILLSTLLLPLTIFLWLAIF